MLRGLLLPDHRKHRGPHPRDQELFSEAALCDLRAATNDLSWLLTHEYAINSSLKLVGDRYRLEARQRTAVSRCACSDAILNRIKQYELDATHLSGQSVAIDGYNILTSIEAALSGGVILKGRDGCYRDMASMHGNYRKVEETIPALILLGELLERWNVNRCRWLLDAPVSNSGRLKTLMRELASEHDWNWKIELVGDPDPILCDSQEIVVSADSEILAHAERWFNLCKSAIDSRANSAWVVDLSGAS